MKNQLKWTALGFAALALILMVFAAGSGPAAAAPQLQMTPGVDPMSAPTVEAPPLDTQYGLPGAIYTGTFMTNGSCPMMGNGSMGTTTGMTGMNGMTGMTGMNGMSGMSGMNGMSGMTGMSGSMPMAGMMDDALSESQGGFFGGTNPWWLIGWILVFALLLAFLAFLVLAIFAMVRQLRKEKPAAPAGG